MWILIAFVVLVVILGLALRAAAGGCRPNRGSGGVILVGSSRPAVSVSGVLKGLLKLILFNLGFVGVTSVYMGTYPPFWVDQWYLACLVDVLVFGASFRVLMPADYWAHLDRGNGRARTPIEFLVGIVMFPLILGGPAAHIAILSSAESWTFV